MTEVGTQKRPIGRPRGAQTENVAQRRAQLIDAAITSIVEVGMSQTTLATVAKAADLSQGVAIFYFKSKKNLLAETLRAHYEEYTTLWKSTLEKAAGDPVEKLLALTLADLDPHICTPRNLTLWNSFWGEAAAWPEFRDICDHYEDLHFQALVKACIDAENDLNSACWSAQTLARALDCMTDGMWARMHISPNALSLVEGRRILTRFLATALPSHSQRILDGVDQFA